jgi:uncharacterized protein (DUF1499 family)
LIFLFNFLILYITNKFKKKPIIENINPSANNIPVCKKISATKSIPKALNKSDVLAFLDDLIFIDFTAS